MTTSNNDVNERLLAQGITKILSCPVDRIFPNHSLYWTTVNFPDSYGSQPRGDDNATPILQDWVAEVMRHALCRTLWPQEFYARPEYSGIRSGSAPKKDNSRYEDQFGIYTVKVRTKAPQSIASKLCLELDSKTRKLQKLHTSTSSERSKISELESSIGDLRVLITTLQDLRTFDYNADAINRVQDAFRALNRMVKDIFGARAVVLTQRCKMNIVRGFNLIITHNASDRFFWAGDNDYVSLDTYRLSIKKDKENPWKFYNPPASFLYSSPELMQRFARVTTALKPVDFVNHADSTSLREVKVFFDELTDNDIVLDFRSSGYATFQRVFTVEAQQEELFHFELQVRTLLEDSWAEPEHRFIYKPGVPLSEHTKAMFRNYGASLQAADDLLQMISDRRQEEIDSKPALNQHSIQNYKRIRGSIRGLGGLDRDLRKVYSLREQGYLSTAKSFLARCIDAYESGFVRDDGNLQSKTQAEGIVVLLLEYSLTLCQQIIQFRSLDQAFPRNYVEAREKLLEAKAICEKEEFKSEKFFVEFRLAHVDFLMSRYLLDHKDEDSRAIVDAIAICSLENRFSKCAESFNNLIAQLSAGSGTGLLDHIETEYLVEDLQPDLMLLECNSLLHNALQDDKQKGDKLLAVAKRASKIRDVCVTSKIAQSASAIGDHHFRDRMGWSARQQGGKNDSNLWPIYWADNLMLFALAVAVQRGLSFASLLTEEISCVFNDLRAWQNIHRGKVFDSVIKFVLNEETIREVGLHPLVDEMGLEPLKILDSLLLYLYWTRKDDANGEDIIKRIGRCAGMVEYRLMEISYLSDYGFDTGFYNAVVDLKNKCEGAA